jgi:hypothetical protein
MIVAVCVALAGSAVALVLGGLGIAWCNRATS